MSNKGAAALQTSTPLPNFFIVGAPKTGSTSLYRFLKQHPQIYMSPVKEPSYFSTEVRPANFSREFRRLVEERNRRLQVFLDGPMAGPSPGGIIETWDDYRRLFRHARVETAIGEASVCYLWSPSAAANIHCRIPGAKIIIILRNPVERAFSQYVHCAANGLVRRSFREQIRLSANGGPKPFDTQYPFLEWGSYYQQVTRYLALFPKTRVRIFLYEEAWRDPVQFLKAVFEYLGVESEFAVDLSRSEHEFRAPRSLRGHYALTKSGLAPVLKAVIPRPWREAARNAFFRPRRALQLEASDRAYLAGYYREDVRKLSTLIDRELEGWLAPPSVR